MALDEARPAAPCPPLLLWWLLEVLKGGASMLRETSWNTGLLDICRTRLGLTDPPLFREAEADLSYREEEWWCPVEPELFPLSAASALLKACVRWVSYSILKKFSRKLLS